MTTLKKKEKKVIKLVDKVIKLRSTNEILCATRYKLIYIYSGNLSYFSKGIRKITKKIRMFPLT
uniref:Uncharacterized protein n=1 Tax=Romanomermis culicivorax TaxID=13658 RepID=A0A915IYZ7_ROMCU